MKKEVDLKKYIEFVYGVTSAPSTDYVALVKRLNELEAEDADVCKLLTAALGLTAESGEFTEVVKKIILHLILDALRYKRGMMEFPFIV